ncbi:uncharacterized protein UV8b_05076 [Ustilaginoidea virens]|uniref:Gag1-like clamp domain-containing protein n=2 Tax=Ustilaginoidea virens TaxID=1159556 RepID=A0A8E5HT13_USTVR|nr:uncharacterized protein UV8b_05076 [Ustilaginoidea virens]QUC20835.1 hypothetical protein UV8b_05076 [Ustilaginoidea virens]
MSVLLPPHPIQSPLVSLCREQANSKASPSSLPQQTEAKKLNISSVPLSSPAPVESANVPGMIFSDFCGASRSPLSKLRSHHSQFPTHLPITTPEWGANEYADLLSRDKLKQKDALKRYLGDKIRNDWEFVWPPAAPAEVQQLSELSRDVSNTGSNSIPAGPCDEVGYQAEEGTELDEAESEADEADLDDDDDDAESVYSVVSEDATHFRPRADWTSDLSDDDRDAPTKYSPFRFHNPNSLHSAALALVEAKRARRRRALRQEMSWNEGLACFEARRNAWTGAKTVRVRSKPVSTPPASPRSPRRFFFRRSISASPPGPTLSISSHCGDSTAAASDTSSLSKDLDKDLVKHRSRDSSASECTRGQVYSVETLLPVGQPLLPPSNPLRASISPGMYLNLYDKVILHSLQPACPINLSDMLRSCVVGWKRDGEWPPRPSAPEPIAVTRNKAATSAVNETGGNVARRMSFGLLGRDSHDEIRAGKGIRRSLQRALGMGVMAGLEA